MATWESWLTVAVAGLLLVGLALRLASTELLALSCLGTLMLVGNLTGSPLLPSPQQALEGFGNSGLITVGLMFAMVAGLELTGGTQLATGWLLNRARGLTDGQLRLLTPVAALSGFLNNTPVVAALLPAVSDLSKRTGISTSRFLLPLSYAAMLGGMCTIIGSSTNLLVNYLVVEKQAEMRAALNAAESPVERAALRLTLPQDALRPLDFFEPGIVGLPAALCGLAYILFFTRWLLPERRAAVSTFDDPRQYTVEMVVTPGGPLIGRTVEEAGLRHLTGLFLVEIQRQGQVVPAVAPTERLLPGDLLILVGALDSVVDLQKIRGLVPATNQTRKLDVPAWHRTLVEAVVSHRCPLVGKSIRAGQFRTRYGAAVIAVARGDQRVPGKLGDVVLEAGDVLLLEAPSSFLSNRGDTRDFYLVSRVDGGSVRRPERAWISLAILVAMVVAASATRLEVVTAALLAAIAMVAFRCCTATEAKRNIDWSVLIVIGATIGIGRALDQSQAAQQIAEAMLMMTGDSKFLALAIVYLVTMLCTESITNNAAAVLMFPIAWNAAQAVDANTMPFVIAVMIAASAGFSTPFGYQTNLMVYGVGGYRFTDYLRFGIPLNLIVFVVAMVVIQWAWPL
ncbi:MAG: SLC13 family permease [Pirellulaceae bacterium]